MTPNTQPEPRDGETTPSPREYEAPKVHDLGSLSELTLSGHGPLSDGFGNASTGGS